MSVKIAIAADAKVLDLIQNTEKPKIEIDPEFGDFYGELEKAREAFKKISQDLGKI
jgi:hypothetical protein